VAGGPFHGYFRYYASAWAASINIQGATVTAPTEYLQVLIGRWFAFDTTIDVVVPPYLEPDLEVDGDFSQCIWEYRYYFIAPVQRAARSCASQSGELGPKMDARSIGTIQSSFS
jgi:hypothetical protein